MSFLVCTEIATGVANFIPLSSLDNIFDGNDVVTVIFTSGNQSSFDKEKYIISSCKSVSIKDVIVGGFIDKKEFSVKYIDESLRIVNSAVFAHNIREALIAFESAHLGESIEILAINKK